MPSFLLAQRPDQPTIDWFINRLHAKGFQVFQSFNLQASESENTPCTCPFQDMECDCRIAVLLVYKDNSSPATFLIHSRPGQVWLLLEDHQPHTSFLELVDRLVSELAIRRWP